MPCPTHLDSAEQIAATIEAAGSLDAHRGARTAGRRALIATLVYAGLRIGEATALSWADIDLANGRINVRDAKTEAGEGLGRRPACAAGRAHEPPARRRPASAQHARLPHLERQPPRQGQRARARDPSGCRRRREAPDLARPAAPAGRRHRAQAAAHVRLDPVRPGRGPGPEDDESPAATGFLTMGAAGSNLRPLACEARSRGGRATAGAGPIVLICRSLRSVVA